MKIYIKNFNIDILQNILNILENYYSHNENFILIYSIEGIFKINKSIINKQIILDKEIEILPNYFSSFTLVLDKSEILDEIKYSIPNEHFPINIKKCYFKINKNSLLSLVIEGINTNNEIENKFSFIPNDIYFEINNNINLNDTLLKKEIIEFLSLLN